jgi:hypothetical protein
MPRGTLAKRYPPSGYTGKRGIFPPVAQVDRWVRSRGDYNIAIRLPEGVIGIDVDAYEGKAGGRTLSQLTAELGAWTVPDGPATVRSSSRGDGVSGIYLFRADLPDGLGWRGELGPGIELVHYGLRYVTAAPSVHPKTGRGYRWLDPDGETVKLPAPADLPRLATAWIERATRPMLASVPLADTEPRYGEGQRSTSYGEQAMLRELQRLHGVWDQNVEAFNPELNKVAFRLGQLAGGGELDAEYARGQLEDLLNELAAPADQYRTLESGFTSGMNQPRRAPDRPAEPPETPPQTAPTTPAPSATTPASKKRHKFTGGALRGDGSMIQVLAPMAPTTKGGQRENVWTRWSDFDMRALGRIVNDDGQLTGYSVELTRERDGQQFETVLPVKTLARSLDLTRWLMAYEVACVATEVGGGPAWNTRLSMYLAEQQAPLARTVPCLGWDDESQQFITYDGALDANGLHPFSSVRPDPDLRGKAIQYHYGFDHTPEVAVHVLREVLTFHDSTVTSVFGAWWAACLLKGQIMQRVAMFPVMAIEATSESGKTSGFFPMMLALAGNKRGQSNDTAASFRDVVAGHRNGVAWQDDLDEPKRLFELLRAATSEGTAAKKAEDRTNTIDARLVAPIMISGEGLDITKQKALADRVLLLAVPSPTSRMSLHDPTRLQWDDIVAMRDMHPDLTALAGHLVVAALRHVDLLDLLPELRGGLRGRHGDKIAIIRLGARVLSAITGDQHHIDVVDRWVQQVRDVGTENALTLSLIPEYLSLVGAVGKPERRTFAPHHSVPTPVLIRPGKDEVTGIWVNTDLLAQWWKEHRSGRVESRTETAEALKQQAAELGMRGERAGKAGHDYYRTRVREADEHTGRAEMRTWQRLPQEVADRLLAEFEQADPPDPSDSTVQTASGGYRVSSDAAARIRAAKGRVRREGA